MPYHLQKSLIEASAPFADETVDLCSVSVTKSDQLSVSECQFGWVGNSTCHFAQHLQTFPDVTPSSMGEMRLGAA